MAKALQFKHDYPDSKYSVVAKRFGVPATTFCDQLGYMLTMLLPPLNLLQLVMDAALVAKINKYAEGGTLLSLRHIQELAKAVCGETLGVNWTSTFPRQYSIRFALISGRTKSLPISKQTPPRPRQHSTIL